MGKRTSAAALFGVALWGVGAGCGQDGSPTPPATPVAPPPVAPAPPPPSPTPPAVVGEWLDANVHPFDGAHLSLPHSDLGFLRDLVGDASVVSLGEATHGTREFFEMKARILRYLVEEMGFDTFAIEATWPESRRLDRYVRTGEGDPRALLSGLYFWTWNTEAVLEMIEWMRDHNAAGGDVGFHGFDMQHPGMALHNVLEYLRRVAPGEAVAAESKLACLAVYANAPTGARPPTGLPRRDGAVSGRLRRPPRGPSENDSRARRDAHVAIAGEDAYAVAAQNLRVATQYHLGATGEQQRDESMAENTLWIRDRIGPDGRMVLWAHNGHVSARPGGPGLVPARSSRRRDGDRRVHPRRGANSRPFRIGGGGLQTMSLDPIQSESFEYYLAAASAPRFVLDLRGIDTGADGASWLAGIRLLRGIGAGYDPTNALQWGLASDAGRVARRDHLVRLHPGDLPAAVQLPGHLVGPAPGSAAPARPPARGRPDPGEDSRPLVVPDCQRSWVHTRG